VVYVEFLEEALALAPAKLRGTVRAGGQRVLGRQLPGVAGVARAVECRGRSRFLFKLKLTNLVRSALHRIKEIIWQGSAILGAG
jgi:hypothetical protein